MSLWVEQSRERGKKHTHRPVFVEHGVVATRNDNAICYAKRRMDDVPCGVTEKRDGQCCSSKKRANDLHVHEAIHKAILPPAWSSLARKPISPTLLVSMYPPRQGQRPSHETEEVTRSSNEMHDEKGRKSETIGRRSCKKVRMR